MIQAWMVDPLRRLVAPCFAPQDVGDLAEVLHSERYSLLSHGRWKVALANDGEGAPDGGVSRFGWTIAGADAGPVVAPLRGRGVVLASQEPEVLFWVLGEDGATWERA